MSDDHTGLYICLIALIIITGAILAVLIYNSDIRLPERAAENPLIQDHITPEQEAMLKILFEGIFIVGAIVFVAWVTWVIMMLYDINK